ncbi:unnamed protein product [Parnassius mnemosyne]|uniref:RNA-directed DNA polymerase n=1 Tax=Parnassius mnemosyne TaxID=213953 RepID=A0AAV1LK01_9NEOP
MPIGKLEPFDLASKQWPAYIRRVQQFILLNEIKSELRVPMLITVVGEATYSLMCDLCSPAHPEDKTFEELVSLVSSHLEPQRSEIAERHVFRLRRQLGGESLAEYLQNLKHLASTCNFGVTLEENLRDQFVSGLASEAMRSRIFAERNIRYKEAVELAFALEAAERHAEVSGATAPASTSGVRSSSLERGEGLHQAGERRGRRDLRSVSRGGTMETRRSQRSSGPCWRCGKPHRADKCRFAQYNCDKCGRRGHLKVMCKEVRDGRQSSGPQHYVSDVSSEGEDFFNIQLNAKGNESYKLTLKVDGQPLVFEVDTGSRISTISERFYLCHFPYKSLIKDNVRLHSYVGSRIESLGFISVNVALGEVRKKNCSLYVIRNGGCPLIGRQWIRALEINQINISVNEILYDSFVSRLISEFPEVFTDKLGTCTESVQLQLSDEQPVYVRARPVPLALRSRVEQELRRLEAEGTIFKVDHSEYGTPIVLVIKENGDIRICGDYKITINPKLKREFHPLPRIEELFAKLSGGEEFSKIDLKNSYQQLRLTEDSRRYTAITTHLGTFVYRRTPFGLSCVPEKFQKIMEETLSGIPGTVVFLDDVCVTGATRNKHLSNLRAVLERLRTMGFTVKSEKCKFLQKSVKYLGFIIDKQGLHPDPKKMEAISNAPTPLNVTQLKSFLGLLNYYGKFIPNLSTILHPLHLLLNKGVNWKWTSKCEQAFREAKRALLGEKVLAHYEEGRPLVLSVDSSAYGLGAVLAHVYPDGTERPVSCVSRTLNASEKNYSQLDKEALAIFFGITKHHQYVFGRRFVLRTDHQPLSYIFGKRGGIPQTAASCLQRWAARLAAYDFSVEFVRSAANGPADALSRLPLPTERHQSAVTSYINLLEDTIPVNFKDISIETKKDTVLSRITGYVMFGWPFSTKCDDEKPYFDRKQEMLLDLGCLIYKYRVVIPPSLRERVLLEIHEGHLGMNKMKNLARNYIYWPGIDQDIENLCRNCQACCSVRDSPPRAVLHPWEFPLNPWQRLHADFAEYVGKKYLIVIDAHSK